MKPRYRCKTAKAGKVGETSSKYGYPGGGEQFEADMAQHLLKSQALYEDFKKWMFAHEVDPETVRSLFVRFYYEFCYPTNVAKG